MQYAHFDLKINHRTATYITVKYPADPNDIISPDKTVNTLTATYEYPSPGFLETPVYDDDARWAWGEEILPDSIDAARKRGSGDRDARRFFDWWEALTDEQHALIDAAQILAALGRWRIPWLYQGLPDDLQQTVLDSLAATLKGEVN